MAPQSEKVFERTLNEKTRIARESVRECIRVFLSTSPAQQRRAAATAAFLALDYIFQMLHQQDHPQWLGPLRDALDLAQQHPDNDHGVEALQRVTTLNPQFQAHQWRITAAEGVVGFDFDAIYKK